MAEFNLKMGARLHDGENILAQYQPESKAPYYWLVSRLWHIVLLVLFWGVFSMFQANSMGQVDNMGNMSSGFLSHHSGLIILGLVIICAILIFWFKLVRKAYLYTVTDQRVILKYGLLSLNTRIIPYAQIADVNLRANLVERLFGVNSVRIDCIGTMFSNALGGRSSGGGNNTTLLECLSPEQCEDAMELMSKHMLKKNN